ncbi:hypothetical protein ACFQZ4_09680 [Catellatospora coxensis]
MLDLKHTHGRWFAVLRGGTHHFRLPAAWGYDHPFTVLPVDRWDYPWPRPEVAGVAVDAVGELCTPATCSAAAGTWPGCGSVTCWCSGGPGRTGGTFRTTGSCAIRRRRSSSSDRAE